MKGLKKRIKDYVDQRVKEVKKHQTQTQQVALDYAQISKLFSHSSFIPYTAWSISPSVILHILNDIVINKRQNIIEFGSGASTLYIAKLIQTLNLTAKFYSVESSMEWLNKMKAELTLYELEDVVTLIHAPIKDAPKDICLNDQQLWYSAEMIINTLGYDQELDLVIVDGPFGGSTPYARYSAIPFLKSRLSKSFGVFLDDSQRKEERIIATQWAALLGIKPRYINRYAYFTSDTLFETAPYNVSKL